MCLESCFAKFSYLKEFPIIIDGDNIAYSRFNKRKKPLLDDIILLINHLVEECMFKKENIFCIVGPSLKYYIDKPTEFKALIKEGIIIESPKYADEFILSFALKHEFCFIISNDKFKQYIHQLPSKQWLEDCRVSFMSIGDQVCLSPNIEYDKINVLLLNSNEVNSHNDIKEEITTIDVFKLIKSSEGEFDLFSNSQKGVEKKSG